jgi:PAS domain S-box-containing protein/putative nucleotidyltransferase with HDIG domain
MSPLSRQLAIVGGTLWLVSLISSVLWHSVGGGLVNSALAGMGGVLLGAAGLQRLAQLPGLPGQRAGSAPTQAKLDLRSLFEESPSALLVFRVRDGIITDANPMAVQLYERPREELCGQHITSLGLLASCCDRDTPLGVAVRHQLRLPEREARDIEVTVNAIPLAGLKLRYAMIQDVTTQAARESHLAAMVAASMDSIIQVNTDQQIILVNAAAEQLFGYTAAQMIGQPLDMLLPEYARPQHNGYVQEFMRTGRTARRHSALPILAGIRSNGTQIPVEISLTTIHTDHQQISTAIVRDASDRVQHEREQGALVRLTAALRKTDTSANLVATMADQISAELAVPHVVVLLYDDQSGASRVVQARGAWAHLADQADQAAAMERHLPTGQSSEQVPTPEILRADGLAITGMVLYAHHQRIGTLWVGREEPFSPGDRLLLVALAEVGASAMRRAQWNERLEQANIALREAYNATIAGWARALDLRDRETEDHSRRVSNLTVALARWMGVPEPEIEHLRRGALLHDIGKMGVPDAILNKAGALTDDERAVMQRHPVDAYHILEPISYLQPALDIPRAHHERWDGSGYPAGLRGEAIPFAARIFAVADVWDAVTNDRPYRAAWDTSMALDYLQLHAGTLFDPQVVQAFVELIREGR